LDFFPPEFPAAILQAPNFDKDRPASMNYGAIGSIIGHEITHAFDDQASRSETWSEESTSTYRERVRCIINQFSSYRVREVEEYFAGVGEFHLNGNFTQKEDIADCGGVKLALRAFQKFERKQKEPSRIPIGLEGYSSEQLFWLSFAQFFCRSVTTFNHHETPQSDSSSLSLPPHSVERPARMKTKVETDVHSLDRFRVNGAASNMREFAEAWRCPDSSPMNPATKCAVW
jgi:predicted metalloendopeptidase